MKKSVKWTLIVLAVIVVIFGVTQVIQRNSQEAVTELQERKPRMLQTEAKLIAATFYTAMKNFELSKNRFPATQELEQALNEAGFSESVYKTYKFGFANENETIKAMCSDCLLSEKAFKLFIYGNVDEDAEFDTWTIAQDKTLFQSSNDQQV